MKKQLLIFCFMYLFLLVGCNKSTPNPEDISNGLFLAYQTGPIIQINGYIDITLENITSACIVFPINYNLRIYEKLGEGEMEIKNTTTYIGTGPRYLKPKGDIESTIFVTFSLDLSNLLITEPTNFYGLVEGHLCDDDSVVIKKKIPFVVMP